MPTDPLMDAQAKVALGATKRLHQGLGKLGSDREGFSDDDLTGLRTMAASANKAVQAMQRIARDQAVQADVREGILREAVRDELIDREANAARVLDRQRQLVDGRGDASTVFERALQSAQQIEASLGALCPYQAPTAPGVAVLAGGR